MHRLRRSAVARVGRRGSELKRAFETIASEGILPAKRYAFRQALCSCRPVLVTYACAARCSPARCCSYALRGSKLANRRLLAPAVPSPGRIVSGGQLAHKQLRSSWHAAKELSGLSALCNFDDGTPPR